MFGKIARYVVFIPLGILMVLLAVANRHVVMVSFDPFSSANPAFQVPVRLFVLIFVVLILGVVIGGAASWWRQGRYRRLVRRLEAENRALHSELYDLKRDDVGNGRASAAPAARVNAPPLALRAPVE
jgi:uncharacterized integral membrane protein